MARVAERIFAPLDHVTHPNTPGVAEESRALQISPPPPPGGYDPNEIARCGFAAFIPLPCFDEPLAVRLTEAANLPPSKKRKRKYNSDAILQRLIENPLAVKFPAITNSSDPYYSHPKPLRSEDGAGSPVSLMKSFVERTYAKHNERNQSEKARLTSEQKAGVFSPVVQIHTSKMEKNERLVNTHGLKMMRRNSYTAQGA